MKKILILLITIFSPLAYPVVNSGFDFYNHSTHKITVTLTPIACMYKMNYNNPEPMPTIKFELMPFSSYKDSFDYLFLGANKLNDGWTLCLTESSRFSISVNYDGQPGEIKNTVSIHWNWGNDHHNDAQLREYPEEASTYYWSRFGFNSDPYWAENKRVFWNGLNDDNIVGLIIIDYYDCDDRWNCW